MLTSQRARFHQPVFGVGGDVENCTACRSIAARPVIVPLSTVRGCCLRNSTYTSENPTAAPPRYTSPSRRMMYAISASHNRAADSTSASRTGCRSKVERLMVLRTSPITVCCWRRLGEIGGLRLDFVKQPDVLDGDHGLIGKSPNQLDVVRGEPLRALTRER